MTGLPFCNSPVNLRPGSSSILPTESLKSQLLEALLGSGDGAPGGGLGGGLSVYVTFLRKKFMLLNLLIR